MKNKQFISGEYAYLELQGYGCGSEDIGIHFLYNPEDIKNVKYHCFERTVCILSKDGTYKCINNEAFRPLTEKERSSIQMPSTIDNLLIHN